MTLYEIIKKIMNEKEDVDLKVRYHKRADFCSIILSHTDRTGFERYDIPLVESNGDYEVFKTVDCIK